MSCAWHAVSDGIQTTLYKVGTIINDTVQMQNLILSTGESQNQDPVPQAP